MYREKSTTPGAGCEAAHGEYEEKNQAISYSFTVARPRPILTPMSILKIARMGHPVLRRRAEPVENPSAPAIHRLIRDMLETLRDADGAGLAAPQVHVPLRLVLFHVPAENTGDDDAEEPAEDAGEDSADSADSAEEPAPELAILITPELEPLTGEL